MPNEPVNTCAAGFDNTESRCTLELGHDGLHYDHRVAESVTVRREDLLHLLNGSREQQDEAVMRLTKAMET